MHITRKCVITLFLDYQKEAILQVCYTNVVDVGLLYKSLKFAEVRLHVHRILTAYRLYSTQVAHVCQ